MCGFCGAVLQDTQPPFDKDTLVRMRDALTHRGPDDAGIYLAPGVALGSRRLSIIDLSERGRMPMSTPDGRYTIAYNGEVYNYRELRREIAARGFAFRSETDTEVVLAAYATWGAAMLPRLNGMFALAIWDARERSLFLARDRMGIKPLYLRHVGDALWFASEPKALVETGTAELDPAAWEELLCFRYTAGKKTPLRGIERLLPGHHLTWRDGEVHVARWWKLADRAAERRSHLPRDPYLWYRDTFDDAVALRRISDVPIGVMLSGGLDSGSVAASLALQAGTGAASFTVTFAEEGYDEAALARQVAERWRLQVHKIQLSARGLLDRIRRASVLLDEPLAHTNDAHMLALSAHAKSRVTVLLSGEGADETLNGYVRYQPLRFPAALRAFRPLARHGLPAATPRRFQKLARFLRLDSDEALVLYNACDVLPSDLERLGFTSAAELPYRRAVLAEGAAAYPDDLLRQVMYSDQHTFLCSLLDRNDRMTMGASIECRVPFLDYRLVETVAALPTRMLIGYGRRKEILRRALGGRLPMAVRRHKKWGFGVPWGQYLRTEPELREVLEALPDTEPIASGPLDRRLLRGAIDRFIAGAPDDEPILKGLVMIAVWHEACVRGRPRTAASAA